MTNARGRDRRRAGLAALLSFAFGLAGGCARVPTYPVTDHCDGERFFNPGVDNRKALADVLRWSFSRQPKPWPVSVPNRGTPRFVAPATRDSLGATWIGHASLLVQLGEHNYLTDPIFSERASPVSFAGPKRVRPPSPRLDELPKVHVVLISHNHYDHLDVASLQALERRDAPVFVVPLGNGELLRDLGVTRVVELDWWESVTLAGAVVTLTPALHWCKRGLTDDFRSLWGSFFVRSEAGRSFYFAGDTGYHGHFAETARRLGPPELALLPIGAYEPRWFMQLNHMNPEEAVRAHLDLGAARSIPMHYATFPLADEGIDAPLADLGQALQALQPARPFLPIEVGASWLPADDAPLQVPAVEAPSAEAPEDEAASPGRAAGGAR